MKHLQEIYRQRGDNMQAGIQKGMNHISTIQNIIADTKAENFGKSREEIIQDLEEIKDFLNWVKCQ